MPTTPTTLPDNIITMLIDFLKENNVRHLSIFTEGEPRIYVSAPPFGGPEASGATLSEAMEQLQATIAKRDELETLY